MVQQKKQSFEKQVAVQSLIIALVPSVILLLLLAVSDISFYLKLLIVILVLTVIAVGTLFIWRRVRNQLRATTNIVEALITGDTAMKPNSNIEQGALYELNQVINEASFKLSEQRLLSKEHHLAMSKVLEHINVAVISVDEANLITLVNPKAKSMFNIQEEVTGLPAASLGIDKSIFAGPVNKVVPFTLGNVQKKVFLQTETYQLHHQKHTLLFLNDVQKLLQNEERTAWQRLLRVLSHEINNSLTPISSIGESLMAVLKNDKLDEEDKTDLIDGLAIMTARAQSLDNFLRQYQTLTKLPEPNKKPISVKQLFEQQKAFFTDLNIQCTDCPDISVYADQEQLAQVFINLFKNAKQACDGNNAEVTVRWHTENRFLTIEIQDNGQGIKNTDNLFVPFYTTKQTGSGIGLVLSRQIMFNHGGDLTLTNAPDQQGAIATLLLPVLN